MTSNQGDAEKGFFEVDISETDAKPKWIGKNYFP